MRIVIPVDADDLEEAKITLQAFMVCNKNTSLDLIIWKTFIKKSSKIFRKLKVFKTSDGKSFRLKALGLKIKNWI